ncbi:hypothetical protein Tco_0568735 [Tanacetum coccineum]
MFDPFGNLSQYYSMWPVILTTYNLPSWLCMKESSFMLTLLIPGLKSSGKDIDVYLRPLIDDLKDLWALKGVETIDVATGQKFNMRAIVLWTINDFPAQSKTAYVGHRRFLKKPHKWRWSLDFNGETENGDPPRKFDRVQIMSQLARLPTHQYFPPAVATPIIELCSFFKKICSQTLLEDDMLKAQSKVVDILCNLEIIYPLAFFDIMINLVIHLPLEALESGPIRPRLEIDTYRAKFKREFPNQDMKEEFPGWFGSQIRQRHMDKDPEDEHDVMHFENSSDLILSTSLNDLDFATLHIDGQSMDVNAPLDIIDVDEDDDIIDEEDAIPHDLTNSDDEDLVNVDDDDDDDVVVVYSNVARGHSGNDRPPPHEIGGGCRGFPIGDRIITICLVGWFCSTEVVNLLLIFVGPRGRNLGDCRTTFFRDVVLMGLILTMDMRWIMCASFPQGMFCMMFLNELEGRSTLRPADILVFGWAEGKHACVDITGVSPLVGVRDNGFVAGQAALKAESSKVAKHEKACLEN